MQRNSFKAALVLLMVFGFPGVVLAHAFLDHAEPKVGSEITKVPKEIKVWFTKPIDWSVSTLEVFDSSGKQIDNQDTHVDPKDTEMLIVSVPALTQGVYKVTWTVVCRKDRHRTYGDFKFTIKSSS